ncbi:alpha-L-rhamnosidase [Klebsiella pneumoniae]|nr:alpha-L-rhamnosidase [Klebsiella pneumoniae]
MQQQDLWLDVLPARVALPRRYCLRYLKVEVKALSRKFRLQFDEIALETVTSAGSPHPAVIADPQLKAIDDVAVRTLKNCMQEVFEDGPKRDRRLWLGDLRLQAQVNDVTFGHHDLVRRCLYLFAGHTGKMAWFPPMSLFSQRYAPMTPFCLITHCFLSTCFITTCKHRRHGNRR